MKTAVRRPLSPAQIEESIRFADGALAAAGHVVTGRAVHDDARRALQGEISFDEAINRAADRALRSRSGPVSD